MLANPTRLMAKKKKKKQEQEHILRGFLAATKATILYSLNPKPNFTESDWSKYEGILSNFQHSVRQQQDPPYA